jgi:hypothetical protein
MHKKQITFRDRNQVLTVIGHPLRLAIVDHILRDLKRLNLLQNAHQLRLGRLNGPIDISTLDIKPRLVVLVITEQLTPVLAVQLLAQDIMHLFAISRQLSKRMLSIGILGRAIILVRVDWVARSMPEQLVDHNQLRLLAQNT